MQGILGAHEQTDSVHAAPTAASRPTGRGGQGPCLASPDPHVPTAGRGPHTQQGLLKAGWKEADEKLGRNSWELPGTKQMPTYVPNTLLCILGAIKLARETWQGYEEQKPHKPAQGSADWVPLEPETAGTRCDQCKLAARSRGWWMRWVGVRKGGGMGAHIPCHKEQQKHRSGRAS